MDKIYASKTDVIEEREVMHAALARKVAADCIVLLENDGVLPLKEEKSVALFGNGARNTVRGGTGSGDVNVRSIVTIEQGFKNAGIEVVSTDWLNRQEETLKEAKKNYLEFINKKAKELNKEPFTIVFDNPFTEPAPVQICEADLHYPSDLAIYVVGRNSGEGADRFDKKGDYQLFDEELEGIKLLTKHYAKTIVVLNIGGVMDLSKIKDMEGINAVVLMSQLGNIGGDALLDVLTGVVSPSGKTADTYAYHYMDYPSSAEFSHNGSVHDEDYTDGVYVGYRYFDSFGVKPLYPFGYGKSYTDFELTSVGNKVIGREVCVKVDVTNIGNTYAGKEVVQVYVTPENNANRPYQELVGFVKTGIIKPKDTETVSITFDLSKLAYYDEKESAWIIDKGRYLIGIGNSSAQVTFAAVIDAKEKIITEKCKKLFALDKELVEITHENVDVTIPENIEVIEIDESNISTKVNIYQGERKKLGTVKTEVLTSNDVVTGKCTLEDLVAQLTVDEMAQLCVGTLRMDSNEVVGNASNMVPGAAGDTSSVIKESRGFKNLILADGPAGLRLQQHFKTDLEGKLLPGGGGIGDTIVPFDPKYDETNSIDYYQYCTAIPIGWALAHSWDVALVEEAGQMIGKEMEQFNVDLWLAPAMNIHRNPLCGRNFEYYSEDPLLTGKMAAAMTKGVQSHPHKGTTIKHFAVNNQEDNRYFVNAHVSERALREIYLKGFEIAVKESQPFSVMTSYNLLNGTHTANHYDLIQSALRDEWGFDGTVMSDWFTSQDIPVVTGKFEVKYPISASTGCIYAGNDIQMPGCQKNVDDIVKAVESGKELDGYTLTMGDLQYNTYNILKVVLKCQ